MKYHCPSQGSFLDPQKTRDGKAYGPVRYEELVKERYLISKTINTSYNDTGALTPLERRYILNYIIEEFNKQKEELEKLKENKK